MKDKGKEDFSWQLSFIVVKRHYLDQGFPKNAESFSLDFATTLQYTRTADTNDK
jgi:hypothetical protein